jgi:hypothetical protein
LGDEPVLLGEIFRREDFLGRAGIQEEAAAKN